MKKYFVAAVLLLAPGGLVTGCGKGPVAPDQVFNGAPAEVKTAWEQAQTADKANDYVAAVTGYRALSLERDKLSHDQIVAVNDAMLAVNARLNAAYQQGDAAAKEAVGKLFQK